MRKGRIELGAVFQHTAYRACCLWMACGQLLKNPYLFQEYYKGKAAAILCGQSLSLVALVAVCSLNNFQRSALTAGRQCVSNGDSS